MEDRGRRREREVRGKERRGGGRERWRRKGADQKHSIAHSVGICSLLLPTQLHKVHVYIHV